MEINVWFQIAWTSVIFISVIVINKIIKFITKKIEKKSESLAPIARTLRNALKYAMWLLGIILFAKYVINLDNQTILTTFGFGSLAITLSAQSLIRDLIMGVLILIEGQMKVGEEVTIKGMTGVVELIGIRTTRLRNSNGDIHTLNNSVIDSITNHSRR